MSTIQQEQQQVSEAKDYFEAVKKSGLSPFVGIYPTAENMKNAKFVSVGMPGTEEMMRMPAAEFAETFLSAGEPEFFKHTDNRVYLASDLQSEHFEPEAEKVKLVGGIEGKLVGVGGAEMPSFDVLLDDGQIATVYASKELILNLAEQLYKRVSIAIFIE